MTNYFTINLFWFTLSLNFGIRPSFDTEKMFKDIKAFKDEWKNTFNKDNNKEVNNNDSNTDL